MGSCCFTPDRRQFLWWYWLLLVSIVGIPMLLAVLYVARQRDGGEEKKKAVGKTAAFIFWAGTFVMSILLYFLVRALLDWIYQGQQSEPTWLIPSERGLEYWVWHWVWLALQFFAAFVAANVSNDIVRKRKWYLRIPLFVLCVAVYLFALSLTFLTFRRPAVNVMQFMVCMLPAHYWGQFKDSPDQARAWKALLAFVVGAALFFVVSRFGEDLAQLICGPAK